MPDHHARGGLTFHTPQPDRFDIVTGVRLTTPWNSSVATGIGRGFVNEMY
jgi:hypothetical protein